MVRRLVFRVGSRSSAAGFILSVEPQPRLGWVGLAGRLPGWLPIMLADWLIGWRLVLWPKRGRGLGDRRGKGWWEQKREGKN